MKPYDLSTTDEILQEAWLREQEGFSFYKSLASQCTVPFVKELLEQLKNEKLRNVQLVESMIARFNLGQGQDTGAPKRTWSSPVLQPQR
jgi:rubrerythrin